jgi:Spy/CpxP family protein refolding chaperone
MKKSIWLLVFLVIGFISLAKAKAQSTPTPDPKAKSTEVNLSQPPRTQLLSKLNLTDQQKQALRKYRASYRKKMVLLDGQLKLEEVELENELEKPEPDQAKLDLITQKYGEITGQKIDEKVKAKLELEKKILNPQQVDQLHELEAKESTQLPVNTTPKN